MIQYVNGPHDPSLLQDKKELFELVPEFHQSFWASTKTLMAREWRRIARNTAFYIGHIFLLGLIGLLYASVFWQFDPKNPQVVLGIVFGTVQFFGFSQNAHITIFMADREIFYRQRGAGLNVKEYVESVFSVHDDISLNILYLLVAMVVFRVFAAWALRFVNHQKG